VLSAAQSRSGSYALSQKGNPMEGYYFIAYDLQDAHAQQCASWIAESLGKVAVMPQQCWTLGDFTLYLEHVVSKAERIIVVLTPGFLISLEPFVQHQRTLVLQERAASSQEHDPVSRLLMALAGDCESLLQDEVVFAHIQEWVDLRPLLNAEQACQQLLLDALCPAKAPDRTASML
jgi:hypothetical protein